MDDIYSHLAEVAAAAEPFVMHLAGTGTFRPPRRSCSSRSPAASPTASCWRRRSVRVRWNATLDFPYHPHVTVAQEIDDAGLDLAYEGLAGFVARFPVRTFALFSREPDRSWRWRTEFNLGPEPLD